MAREPKISAVRERIASYGLQGISDGDLLSELCGRGLPNGWPSIGELAGKSVAELEVHYTPVMARRVALAIELGRRVVLTKPALGERCLDPNTVWQLNRDLAAEQVECFAVVLLDVRGRLLARHIVARSSVTQCPVAPREVLRPAVREAAHSVIFVHNHPSGDPSPSPEDVDLTGRLRVASEVVGIVPRDHVIVAAGGYFSFVEAGRWRG